MRKLKNVFHNDLLYKKISIVGLPFGKEGNPLVSKFLISIEVRENLPLGNKLNMH